MNTVYIELILLDNFFMDFVILYYTVRISVKNARLLRVLLAAVLGGVYSVFAVFCDILISPVFKVAASFILITAAGGVKSLRSFFVSSAVFYGFSAGAAGLAVMLSYMDSGKLSGKFINAPALRYVFFGLFLFVVITEIFLRRKQLCNEERCELILVFGKNRVKLSAAVDTGNSLCDSSGDGVIIADMSEVLSQMDVETVSDFFTYASKSFTALTVSGKKELKGAMPKEITIKQNGRKIHAKGYVALAQSVNFKGCRALLPENIKIV